MQLKFKVLFSILLMSSISNADSVLPTCESVQPKQNCVDYRDSICKRHDVCTITTDEATGVMTVVANENKVRASGGEGWSDQDKADLALWLDDTNVTTIPKNKKEVNKELPTPIDGESVSPTPDRQVVNKCQQAIVAAEEECDESKYNIPWLRGVAERAAGQALSLSNATGSACTAQGDAVTRLYSAIDTWKAQCSSKAQTCAQDCGNLPDQKKLCDSAFGKMNVDSSRAAQLQNAQQARQACDAAALAASQVPAQGLANNTGMGMPTSGGSSSSLGSGFSPATASSANYGIGAGSGGDRNELATGRGGAGLGSGSGDEASGAAINGEYQKSKVDQWNAGAGGGMSGKVTYSDSSLPKSKQQPSYGGGGSSYSNTVNSGFYGGGAAAGGSSAWRQASIAPVGGYKPGAGYNPNLRAKPDLRRFLPPGGPQRVAASGSLDSSSRGGMTGPQSNNFNKIRNRYNAYRATLVP